jgi:exosortase/archaeosortase family protein
MEDRDLKQYSIEYLIFYILTFFIIYFSFQLVPSRMLELITAQASAEFFNFFGLFSRFGVYNDYVYLTLESGIRDVYVLIIRECTAIHVWGVLFSLVIPLKAELKQKILSVGFGASLVFVMNITRIIITIYLTGYNVPPFSWFFQSPTVETYHYPISFIYGVIGIIILILTIDKLFLPELGELLINLPGALMKQFKIKLSIILKEADSP